MSWEFGEGYLLWRKLSLRRFQHEGAFFNISKILGKLLVLIFSEIVFFVSFSKDKDPRLDLHGMKPQMPYSSEECSMLRTK